MDAGHDIIDVKETAPDLIEALDHVDTLDFVDPLVDPPAQQQQQRGAHGQHATDHQSYYLRDFSHNDSLALDEPFKRLTILVSLSSGMNTSLCFMSISRSKNWPT